MISLFKNKIVFTIITIITVIIVFFAVAGMETIAGYMFFVKMLIAYAILWIITIPYMIWNLLPSNKATPLSGKWKVSGFILFILGYPPAIFMAIESFYKGWDERDFILIPIFLGPIFIYHAFKIKNTESFKNEEKSH